MESCAISEGSKSPYFASVPDVIVISAQIVMLADVFINIIFTF